MNRLCLAGAGNAVCQAVDTSWKSVAIVMQWTARCSKRCDSAPATREHGARERTHERNTPMIRIRTLIATALLTLPVLALSAAAPTSGLGKSFDAVATSGS